VDAALQEAVGEELQTVRNIDCDTLWVWFHMLPLSFGSAHLKRCDRLSGIESVDDLSTGAAVPEEKGQAAKISVAFDPHIIQVGILLWGAMVILHVPEMAITLFGVTMIL